MAAGPGSAVGCRMVVFEFSKSHASWYHACLDAGCKVDPGKVKWLVSDEVLIGARMSLYRHGVVLCDCKGRHGVIRFFWRT